MLDPQPERRLSPSDLWTIPRVGVPAPAPDGSFFVVGVTTYAADSDERRERLYLVRPGAAGSAEAAVPPRPLTAPEVASSQPVVSPDGKSVAFLRKPHDGEHPQLYVMPLDGGEARRLTDLPLGVSDPRWLPDGRGIVVLSALYRGALTPEATRELRDARAKLGARPHVTEARIYRFWDRWLTDGEVHHLFVVDVATGAARDLIPGWEKWFDLWDPSGDYAISPAGDEIAFSASASPPPHEVLRNAIYSVPTGGGEPTCLTPKNPAEDRRPRYSPDGRYLIYGHKLDLLNYADRMRLTRVDRSTGEHSLLTPTWDVSPTAWEFADADTLILEAETNGRTYLYRMSLTRGGTPELIARGGAMHGITPAADGFIYMQHHSMVQPPEVARCPVQGDAGAIERLTHFTDEAMAGFKLGTVEDITFPGAGSDPVHMYLLLPPGYDATRRYPLIHAIHGGPYGLFPDAWHFRWNAQVLAAPGYVVAMVNFHGSASYGQPFSDAILGDWGGMAAEDILRATDLLIDRKMVDPARMAISGGSFGGYMACWLPTRTDRFACSIAHAAVYNLGTLCASDVTQGVERDLGGEPWDLPRAREALDRHNPASHTGAYRTPTLITHGEKDYRVPVQHAFELYGMLKAKGVDARLVHYPDENHWILKKSNSLHWYGEVFAWLSRFLKEPG